MKTLNNFIQESTKDRANLSLSIQALNNLLFTLAYTYKWDDEADKWKKAEYEDLYITLYKEGKKVFGDEFTDFNEENIEKVQTRA
jgi:hypothetical protein